MELKKMDEEQVLLVVEDGVVEEVGEVRHLPLQVARPSLGDPWPTLQPQCLFYHLGVKLGPR